MMNETTMFAPTVVRTNRGLSIAGTRITLYQIMEHLKAQEAPARIRDLFGLTIKQMRDVLAYLDQHRKEVEAEYQEVLKEAEADRKYWEERNRERFAQIAAMPPKPGQEKLWTKLQETRKRLGL